MSDLNALNGTYVIDPAHSEIGFVARHAMVKAPPRPIPQAKRMQAPRLARL